ncbi:phosphoribosylaminoimidazolesuccinocarboxamide synthase [Leucobacter aridicollis]|uniref:Phosphoribosylaminoimidazole-succinocarboxamide synthase n=1 Tax=Leucobacter aridicollis TaxID=283878 RepID=A0A852RFQ6_9MICO|nr:phosphoribosylaminoimidazolesuccinocarboxamide synthase [Leucobacter aridicollis]MBL3683305.1 phosphoribosylaminoimidazolesuccinocarboxamide synthase [Leucobacter aridicollis]NYD25542.1 phosphoribosylaminoimidazole-succinocarboxamide synthase [Leucobacter aridicollis]
MNVLPTPLALPGWSHTYSGKVRDLYVPEGTDAATSPYLLVVASNRVSAFDFVLEPPIPGKGALLTALSNWWFSRIPLANHLAIGEGSPAVPEAVADRAVVSRRLEMYPVECVVRGALTGSGFVEYQQTGAVCGIELPAGLNDGDQLEEPIYTPAYKAPFGEHDENITFERSAELVGQDVAEALRDASLKIFTEARDLAAERGVVLADTKFEFGKDPVTGELVLADEVLTSDSSRYWDASTYFDETLSGAERLASFDKQIVRNWLAANWDKQGVPPVLPAEIVEQTYARYRELYVRLTGEEPAFAPSAQ